MRDPFHEEVSALPRQITWMPQPTGMLSPSRIVFAGMGGSALASEMAAVWIGREHPCLMVRESRLPDGITSHDTVVCVSCSGNTAETLAVWEEAGVRGLARAAVSTGGRLLEAAEQEEKPFVRVPGGLSPRSSMGYLVRGCLGLVPLKVQPCWEDLASHLAAVKDALESDPDPACLRRWAQTGLLIVSSGTTSLAARRWSADFAENAKLPLWIWEFPEASHNALMVLAAEAPRPAPSIYVLESQEDLQSSHWQEFMALLRDTGCPLEAVRFPHSDTWIELFGLAYAGDWFSLHFAESLGVSAGSLSLLDTFKNRLGKRLKS